jgi:hypothetical protein
VQHVTDKGREERHESPDREVERHVELAELGARPTAKVKSEAGSMVTMARAASAA